MRPDRDSNYLAVATLIAVRGTCGRRQVGCVLINAAGRILATGYNGVAAGAEHCRWMTPCAGAGHPSGEGLDECEAIHAEQNALVWCREADKISTAYVTIPPCIPCLKLLVGTSCQRIVTRGAYPQATEARDRWEMAGRAWVRLL